MRTHLIVALVLAGSAAAAPPVYEFDPLVGPEHDGLDFYPYVLTNSGRVVADAGFATWDGHAWREGPEPPGDLVRPIYWYGANESFAYGGVNGRAAVWSPFAIEFHDFGAPEDDWSYAAWNERGDRLLSRDSSGALYRVEDGELVFVGYHDWRRGPSQARMNEDGVVLYNDGRGRLAMPNGITITIPEPSEAEPYSRSGFIDLNESGMVVGNATFLDGYDDWGEPIGLREQAFRWSIGGHQILPELDPIAREARATAVNDSGWVVGESSDGYNPDYPWLEEPVYTGVLWVGDEVYDLNDLVTLPDGYHIRMARDINDDGDILVMYGEGNNAYTLYGTAVLRLVPAPGAAPVLALGLATVRRRREVSR